MPRVPLIATKVHQYAGKVLTPGESFEALSRDDAQVLKVIGAATDPPEPEEPTTIMVPPSDIVLVGKVRTRRYRRRDLEAED